MRTCRTQSCAWRGKCCVTLPTSIQQGCLLQGPRPVRVPANRQLRTFAVLNANRVGACRKCVLRPASETTSRDNPGQNPGPCGFKTGRLAVMVEYGAMLYFEGRLAAVALVWKRTFFPTQLVLVISTRCLQLAPVKAFDTPACGEIVVKAMFGLPVAAFQCRLSPQKRGLGCFSFSVGYALEQDRSPFLCFGAVHSTATGWHFVTWKSKLD